MADAFENWFMNKMLAIGYEAMFYNYALECTVIRFKKQVFLKGIVAFAEFDAVYIKKPITLDDLRILFQNSPNTPLLIIVDSDLVSAMAMNDNWLRAIHALYYGRVYMWSGAEITAAHWDRDNLDFTQSEPIQFKTLKFEMIDSWYKAFPGDFNVAHFNEGVFWKVQEKPPKRDKKAPPPPDSAEEFWRKYYERNAHDPNWGKYTHSKYEYSSNEDVYEQFKRAYEREKARHQETHEPPPPRPRSNSIQNKWVVMMLEPKTLEGAKRVYRQLAKENHPDVNKSPDAIEVMQAINIAYEMVVEMLE